MKTTSSAGGVKSRVRWTRSASRMGFLGVFTALLGAAMSVVAVGVPSSVSASVATNAAPVVTTQPTSQYYNTGQTLTFTAAASGIPTPTVQWQLSVNGGSTWIILSGSTSDSLTTGTLNGFENGWEVRAVFTNSPSSTPSNAATMTLATAPVVTTQPTSQYYNTGQTLTFTAAASGIPTPTVQWQLSVNGGSTWIILSGSTSDSLTTGTLNGFENGWEVRAVFTNSASSTPSNAAMMTVLTANASFALANSAFQSLQQNLYLPTNQLYMGDGTQFSFLWPFTNATAGTEYLAGVSGGAQYLPDVEARLAGLLEYRDTAEMSPTGASQPAAFESAVGPPLGSGGATYYDDNAWVTLDLLHQYQLDHDASALQLAEQTFSFIETGWSANPSATCPGGVYWIDSSSSSQRNTTSTAASAEAAVELYQVSGSSSYLDWAEQMYDWVNQCLAVPAGNSNAGLYYDHINSDGTINTAMWSYNQGSMIGAGVLLAKATGDNIYLQNADNTAQAALSYFGTGTELDTQGPAFNGIYFRNLFLLNQITPNSGYAAEAQTYATYMWNNERSPSTGLFSSTSGVGVTPDYNVNGTAPMVEVYSLLAGSAP